MQISRELNIVKIHCEELEIIKSIHFDKHERSERALQNVYIFHV